MKNKKQTIKGGSSEKGISIDDPYLIESQRLTKGNTHINNIIPNIPLEELYPFTTFSCDFHISKGGCPKPLNIICLASVFM